MMKKKKDDAESLQISCHFNIIEEKKYSIFICLIKTSPVEGSYPIPLVVEVNTAQFVFVMSEYDNHTHFLPKVYVRVI